VAISNYTNAELRAIAECYKSAFDILACGKCPAYGCCSKDELLSIINTETGQKFGNSQKAARYILYNRADAWEQSQKECQQQQNDMAKMMSFSSHISEFFSEKLARIYADKMTVGNLEIYEHNGQPCIDVTSTTTIDGRPIWIVEFLTFSVTK
jgi:hypothetical protein